jgi:hypothetical protein
MIDKDDPDSRPCQRCLIMYAFTLMAGSLLSIALGCELLPVDVARVTLTVSPGKPGAPTESVEVSRVGERRLLRVARVGPEGEVLAEQEVTLAAQDFDRLWRFVSDARLESFEPREAPGAVADFGEIRLRRETATGDSKSEVDVAWQRPLKNEADVAPLLRALARLARERAPDVKMHYLPHRDD